MKRELRGNVNIVKIDLNMKKSDRELKEHNNRRNGKKKRMHLWTNPYIRSGHGHIESQ